MKNLRILVLSLLAMFVTTVKAVFYEDLFYEIVDGEAIVFYQGGLDGRKSVVIPETVTWEGKTYKVTGICSRAFESHSLEEIKIGNNVRYISDYAFYNCRKLKKVEIGNGVTEIGSHAFRDCSSLENVTMPDNVTAIGESVFRNCISLTSITMPNNLTTIGEYAFYNCI